MKYYYHIISLTILSIICGCKGETERVDFEKLTEKYSANKSDSLKLQALNFIKENIKDISSEQLEFYADAGGVVNIDKDTITSDKDLEKIMEKRKLNTRSIFKPDTELLTTELLDANITKAVNDWVTYPWARNVPKEIFLNYLLPYKILNEYPENWREYFSHKYADSIKRFTRENKKDVVGIYKSIFHTSTPWFKYTSEYPGILKNPSLSDLIRVKNGECFRMSHFNVYSLRALGIPATIDIVPLWGDKSGSHATDVFYRKTDEATDKYELKPMIGSGIVRPPKVFRYSFKKTNSWTDSIQPLLHPEDTFPLHFLKTNHLIDVTNEYTSTVNLKYPLKSPPGQNIAYICVFNYGKWRPLFYGRTSRKNNSIIFNNMGKDIMYHIAIPMDKTFTLIDSPFLLDSTGRIVHSNPNYKIRTNLKMEKINMGTEAWVKKGLSYDLYFLDEKGERKLQSTQLCKRDSAVHFSNVPINAFYILIDKTKKTQLSRYFSIKNGKQIWY